MKLYRQRPLTVEAMRLEKPFTRVVEFCPGLDLIKSGNVVVWARLPDSAIALRIGDFLVKKGSGKFVVMSPEDFHASYEPLL